jgi:hypothetical protein
MLGTFSMSGFSVGDVVDRTFSFRWRDHEASESLKFTGFRRAYYDVSEWLSSNGLRSSSADADVDSAFSCFSNALKSYLDVSSAGRGGVSRASFLALCLIQNMIRPKVYVESGVFRGASMCAILCNPEIETTLAFDPNPGNFVADLSCSNSNVVWFTDDFGAADLSDHTFHSALAYFDDHVNTADRIIQSHRLGIKFLLFDDSCGLTGSAQRVYPSMPSLWFISNSDRLSDGDFLRWSALNGSAGFLDKLRLFIRLRGKIGLSVTFDEALIEKCKRANELVESISRVPSLRDCELDPLSGSRVDGSQFFVVLRDS